MTDGAGRRQACGSGRAGREALACGMRLPMELLAPAGGREQLEYAVRFGADAVYLATDRFGMRRRASNFRADELADVVAWAHERGVAVHVACNIVMRQGYLTELADYLELVGRSGADALIVSDLGAMRLARPPCPRRCAAREHAGKRRQRRGGAGLVRAGGAPDRLRARDVAGRHRRDARPDPRRPGARGLCPRLDVHGVLGALPSSATTSRAAPPTKGTARSPAGGRGSCASPRGPTRRSPWRRTSRLRGAGVPAPGDGATGDEAAGDDGVAGREDIAGRAGRRVR